MNTIQRTDIINWEDFVEIFKNKEMCNDLIYRGQSNSPKKIEAKNINGKIVTKELIEWKLESTFSRYYSELDDYHFQTFLNQQLDPIFFNSNYKSYKISESIPLCNWDVLNKLYFLQHYGCPTCLIDFSKNPLKALYFAISSMKGSSGYSLDYDWNINIYPDNCFLSIYAIDCKVLKQEMGIKIIDENTDISKEYDNFKIELNNDIFQNIYLGLIENPIINEINFNLARQEGCFILYDNNKLTNIDLETLFEKIVKSRNIVLSKPLINIYRISYNSIFMNRRKNKESLFSYLKGKGIYGATLFNDIQGLKYDLNFFHQL
jgi:hypothetical protein